jgi:rmeS
MREDWDIRLFKDVFDLQMGKTPDRKNFSLFEGDNTWVSIKDLDGKYISSSKECISDEAAKNIKLVKRGTVIMSFKLTVGKTAIAGKDLYTNEAIMAFNLRNGYDIDASFLYYYLKNYRWEGSNKAVMGITLNKATISKHKIAIPPKPTQLSIVSELDKLNELIRIKKEQLKDYDTLAQSIFYEMFGDPVENEKGWEVKELIETVSPECKISYGIVQPGEHVEDGVSIVRPVDMVSTFISKDGLKKTTKEISNSYSRTILSGKELLVCVRGTTGVVSLVDESLQGANVTRGIAPLLFSENVERWFMYYQVKSSSVRGVISSLTRGIALKQINMSDLRKIRLILPPLSLQQSFAHKIEQIERQKAAVQSTITDLETLLAARMQYWFD